MREKDYLLAFVSIEIDKSNKVSPIQIMKGMFLIDKRFSPSNFYEFKPYLYGPCSFQIYEDLEKLEEEGYIQRIKATDTWDYYSPTSKGIKSLEGLDPDILEKIKEIKEKIVNKSFLNLLRFIYGKYPEYARESIVNIDRLK